MVYHGSVRQILLVRERILQSNSASPDLWLISALDISFDRDLHPLITVSHLGALLLVMPS